MELDRVDRQLLNLVQQDSSRTAEQLASQLANSPSAVQRRLRRLREEDVIVREVAVVDPKKVGGPTFFVVSLQVERDRPESLTRLRAWVGREPCIQQAYYVTGEADFVLIVIAQNTEAYDALMSRLMAENPNVVKFSTNVTLGIVKRGLAIPISSAAAEG
jgi:DNA-binding Lrp family transcriptional regulator